MSRRGSPYQPQGIQDQQYSGAPSGNEYQFCPQADEQNKQRRMYKNMQQQPTQWNCPQQQLPENPRLLEVCKGSNLPVKFCQCPKCTAIKKEIAL
jgi:hypothetical protein